MTESLWADADAYVTDLLVRQDDALERALAESSAAGLPAIAVSPPQGKLLWLLARMQRASAILEIGTLGGYSTIWLARGLEPGGLVTSVELSERHAAVARANVERAGVAGCVDIRVGAALDLLPSLAADGVGPFDLTFIDADKANIPDYFTWALELSRPGAVIVVDNVIRSGAVLDTASTDADVLGVRRLNAMLADEPRVSATTIQTVGAKGYDGLTLAYVER